MFETLSDRLDNAVNKIKGYGVINENNISETMKEIKLALLEADVNYGVVKKFISNVKEKALGEEVKKSLKPSEVFLKILKDELVILLGTKKSTINLKGNPAILMLVGLQGSGKTTTIGKLGKLLKEKHKKKPLLVACDIYRPAAIDQLITLGKQLDIEVYSEGKKDPVEIAINAVEYARKNGLDYVLIDTAGRLHINDELMKELENINKALTPKEILLVIDSMMGQDAVNVINGFNSLLPLTGTILTKLDGDTKGGAALSVRQLTDTPIKYIGVSEKLDGLDEFDPERMASRILGMGDLMSIVEKVESTINKEEAKQLTKKMKKGKFDLEDFLNQMDQIKKLGPLENIIKMLPQAKKMGLNNINIDPKKMKRIEAIILSMTPKERKHPEILKASRKIRIAKGAGVEVSDVNRLLKQFEEMKKMMKNNKFTQGF